MASDTDRGRDEQQDMAVAGTFPASDPPAGTGESGSRAVPPQEMMGGAHRVAGDAVTLRRRFPDAEAAKLALEGLVRDAPLDRRAAEMSPEGGEVELRIAAPPADEARLRDLLARA
jgi:hypothetical protein